MSSKTTSVADMPMEDVEMRQPGLDRSDSTNGETDAETVYPSASPIKYMLTLLAMCIFVFVAGFDFAAVTMVLPTIGTRFSKFKSVNWLITAYLLGLASVIPSVSKLCDVCGRRVCLIVFAALYIAGLAMSGASNEMRLLLAGRGIAGVGASGCIAIPILAVSGLGSQRQRVGGLRIMLVVWLAAAVLGFIAGGRLVSKGSWRWVFYLNIPCLAVALFLAVPLMGGSRQVAKGASLERLKRVDILGTLLIAGSALTLILGLNFGGDLFEWASGVVIVLLILGVFLFALFAFVEIKFATEPLVPLAAFKERSSMALVAMQPFLGVGIFTPAMYLVLWYDVIRRESKTSIGDHLLTIPLVALVLSVASGVAIRRWGKYLPFVWLSAVFLTAGCGALLALNEKTSSSTPIGYMVLLGIGIGLSTDAHIYALQSAAPTQTVLDIVVLLLFLRLLGAVVGIALFNTILQNNLTTKLAAVALSHPLYYKYILMSVDNQDIIRLPSVPQSVRDDVIQANAEAFTASFVACVVFAAVAIPLCVFVRHVPMLNGKLRTLGGAAS
ncbi:hypothetical protein GGI07_002501 [Coemansia sp. Benny D115]|nr:hypothetical protein GGI07_002501 [Coemansia sp. Benny D115]